MLNDIGSNSAIPTTASQSFASFMDEWTPLSKPSGKHVVAAECGRRPIGRPGLNYFSVTRPLRRLSAAA
jgi:hypothetical protein